MSTQRHPKGIPSGGQFAASAHDEATAPLAPEEVVKSPEDVKVGDIVWNDGWKSGFAVSRVERRDGNVSLWSDIGAQLFYYRGEGSVTVLRDEGVLKDRTPAPASTRKPTRDVKVGDIVWDGESGFAVSRIEHYVEPPLPNQRRTPPGDSSGVRLYSAKGDFWQVSPRQSEIVVMRDEDALQEALEDQDW